MQRCVLCGLDHNAAEPIGALEQQYRVQCARCGEYVITDEALSCLDPAHEFVKKHLYLLSAVARRSWERGVRLLVDRQLLSDQSVFEARVLSQCLRRVGQKVDGILLYVAEHSDFPGGHVKINLDTDYPLFFCHGPEELRFHLNYLKESGKIDLVSFVSKTPWQATLSTLGWDCVEQLQKPNIESKQAFVAMWFDGQMDSAFKDGILTLEEATGFRMLRIDTEEFNDKICDHIIAEIRRSRFLIADVTGHRHAVYYEAGFAMGLGLPVIWTCRTDAMDELTRKFDTRQYNHITWGTPEELRGKLKDRILATIGSARRLPLMG